MSSRVGGYQPEAPTETAIPPRGGTAVVRPEPQPTLDPKVIEQVLLGGEPLRPAMLNWLSERYWKKESANTRIDTVNGCLLWTGARFSTGYGVVHINRRPVGAHRIAYAVWHGILPKGKSICHSCDTPSCVNVEHLFAGSPKDNSSDMVRKSRQARGERAGPSRLTSAQVAEIRKRYTGKRGEQPQLAREFGVSSKAIGYIVRGQSWR